MIINKEKWNKFKNKVNDYFMREALESMGLCNCFRCKEPLSEEEVKELLQLIDEKIK